ncbi:MAG: 16S rRNA (cytosine(1402)-N(4))-methyltransferase RsmH [candidate division FCPU426 bacterium]
MVPTDPGPNAGRHRSVLLAETLQWLDPRPEGWWVDATVGGGGHTAALLEAVAPGGRVLGIDRDRDALAVASERLAGYGGRLVLVQANYRELPRVIREQGIPAVRGMIMDLGVSSFQLDNATRGFSFLQPGPLDMRMDQRQARTAADILNHASERELADLFYTLGEEPRSRRLAQAVVHHRPLRLTTEFAALAARACGGRRGKIHPATRAFQALRLAVNEELEGLREAMADARGLIAPGGRLVVISFHSLEDRIVKLALREEGWERLTPHVVRPGEAERRENPRARSARLRAARRREG